MKKALTTAIYSRLSTVTNSLDDLIGGKMFDAEAPPGTVDPYVVYHVVSYTDISTFAEETYDVLLQFSIFSSTESSIESNDIEAALNAEGLFRNQGFTFTGGKVLEMTFIQSDGPRKVIEESAKGESSYWQTDIDFNIIIEKS